MSTFKVKCAGGCNNVLTGVLHDKQTVPTIERLMRWRNDTCPVCRGVKFKVPYRRNGPRLVDVNIRKSVLRGHDFQQAQIYYTNMKDVVLTEANLCGADINVRMDRCTLVSANCSFAHMIHCWLKDSNCTQTNFYGANLYFTNFDGCDLTGADFTQAHVFGCSFDGATGLKDTIGLWEAMQQQKLWYVGAIRKLRTGGLK